MDYILDARKLGDRETAHAYLRRIFAFPDYYGNNLDALYDCLSERSNLRIHLLHEQEAGPYYSKILDVFEDLSDAEIFRCSFDTALSDL